MDKQHKLAHLKSDTETKNLKFNNWVKHYKLFLQFGSAGETFSKDMCMEVDPDLRDAGNDRELVEIHVQKARSYLKDHFPQIDHHEPAIIEKCIYTVCMF